MSVNDQKTILLVEDEAVLAMTEKIILETFGYNVIMVNSGEEAVAAVEKTPAIDLVLMDINLGPGLDGTEAAALILKDRDLPVVFLSSHTEPEVVAKTEKSTSYGYVVKNSSNTVLDASIKMAFKLFEAKTKEKEKESRMEAALEALRESEAKYRLLIENSHDIIYTLSADGVFTFVSPAWTVLLGHPLTQVVGKPFQQFVHPNDLPGCMAWLQKVIKTGQRQEGVDAYRVRHADGSWRLHTSSAVPLRDKAGMVIGFEGTARDITERKRIERELRESQALTEAVVESVPLMIFLKEATDLKFVIFNRAGEELLGHDRQSLLGKNNLDLFPPEQAAHFMAKDREVLDGEAGMLDIPEEPILTAKKGTRLLHTRKVCIRGADGKTKYLLGISEDITERKQVELALRESEERFHSFFDNSNAGIYRTAPDGSIHLTNPALVRMLGYSSFADLADKDLNKTGFEPSYPRAQFVAKIEKDGEVKGLESVWKRKDGGTLIVRESARAIRDRHGKTLFYDGIVEDITERKQAQTALQENNSRLELAMQAAEMAWWEMDLPGGHVFFAKRKAEMLGFSPSQFKHYRDFVALVHPEDQDKKMNAMREHLDGSLPRYEVDYRIATSSGEYVWFHDIGSVGKRDANGKPLNVTGLVINISGRKKAEAEIQRQLTEKEILLKEVHHRIKNNITSIGALLSLHLKSTANPEVIAVLQDAIGRVSSMGILYDKLLLSEEYKVISVKNYIESLADTVITLFPGSARIKIDRRIDDFQLDPKRLFPLGIIINELLTNKMKYAFINRKTGLMKILLENVKNHITLTIEDNGNELPAGFDVNEAKGFGLMLVKMLCQQLAASFTIEKDAGTRCKVEFDI